jgi:hypothetical protein
VNRDGGIRTRDLLNPIQARYRTAPRPEREREKRNRGGGIRTRDLCDPNAALFRAELLPACGSQRPGEFTPQAGHRPALGFLLPGHPLDEPQSGRPGSNRRPQPWQGCALPTELRPHNQGKPQEPPVGLEPTTPSLRVTCSTIELRWRRDTAIYAPPSGGSTRRYLFRLPALPDHSATRCSGYCSCGDGPGNPLVQALRKARTTTGSNWLPAQRSSSETA